MIQSFNSKHSSQALARLAVALYNSDTLRATGLQTSFGKHALNEQVELI